MEQEIPRRFRNIQKEILDVQQRLVTLINQKTGQLANSQNHILKRLSNWNQEIIAQISQVRLSCNNSLSEHSSRSNITSARVQEFNNSLAISFDKLTLVQQTIASLHGNVEVTRNQIHHLEGNLQKQILRVGDQLSLVASNSLNTPHFNAVFETNKLAITYLAGDGHWRGFIRSLALPLNTVNTYQIRQTKTTMKCVMTGIATNAVFGKITPHNNNECLAYNSYEGYLHENGVGRKVGRVVSDGEVIAIRVDTANWEIRWSVGNQELAATAIPQQMRNKSLYILVIMYNLNDVVELLLG